MGWSSGATLPPRYGPHPHKTRMRHFTLPLKTPISLYCRRAFLILPAWSPCLSGRSRDRSGHSPLPAYSIGKPLSHHKRF